MKNESPSLSQLAGSAAHALNNVLSVLFAAAGHLEAAGEARPVARARAALDDACGAAQALSAALSLLAIEAEDVAAALVAGGGPEAMEAEDWPHLAEMLRTVAAVAWDGQPPAGALALPLSRDVIESVLACAAMSLKRSSPPDATQRLRAAVVPGESGGAPALAIELAVSREGGAGGEASRPSPHPCTPALAHSAAVLAPLGVRIDARPGERVGVTVKLAG